MPAPKCDQCDSAIINGVYCHEAGCPNRLKAWDPGEERWILIDVYEDQATLNVFGDVYTEARNRS